MNAKALSTSPVAIALAAISFAGPASAGLLLCGDVTHHTSVQTPCDDNNIKNKHRIDSLFDAEAPVLTSVLTEDWHKIELKFKSSGRKLDERLLQLWHPLGSGDWSFGGVFVHDRKWAQAQPHGGSPNRNIPEPGSFALLSIGLVGAALSRRCKRI